MEYHVSFFVLLIIMLHQHFSRYYYFLAGKMNLKTKNKVCIRIIEEMCNNYDGAKEFVDNRIKELCVQDTILISEVRIWFKVNLFWH